MIRIFLVAIVLLFSNGGLAQEFPLPQGSFVSAKMPLGLVYPRPDNETPGYARHRVAHPAMTYEIPIGVQGGAWPFKYELIESPSGASIGNFHGDDNYGVVSWVPGASAGRNSFTVRVTDQELNTIDINWTVEVDESAFVFIQDGWSGEKVGTIDKPLEDVADWYLSDENDDTYHNKVVVFRNGNYDLLGDPSRDNNVRLNANAKTPSLIGFPGESAVIDCSRAKVFTDNGSIKDVFIADLKWTNARSDVNNAHFFWAVGDVSRSTWWRNHFDKLPRGLRGTDNPAAVFISSPGRASLKEYVLYKENLHTEINNAGSNGAYIDVYSVSYLLIEQNEVRDSRTYAGFWGKESTSFVSIRANEAWDNVQGTQIEIGYGNKEGVIPHDHEVCWNKVKLTNPGNNAASMLWAGNTENVGKFYNSFIYRNTIIGGSAWIRFLGSEPYEVEGNVFEVDNPAKWKPELMTGNIENLILPGAGDVVDVNGRLRGDFRRRYLGRVGYEIAVSDSSPPIIPPRFEATGN